MCFIFSLIPATFWTVIGYFVLFSTTKSEGAVHKFGKVLAVWIFIIALLFPIIGAYLSISGLCPIGEILKTIHYRGTP